jgi:hypothetical protein
MDFEAFRENPKTIAAVERKPAGHQRGGCSARRCRRSSLRRIASVSAPCSESWTTFGVCRAKSGHHRRTRRSVIVVTWGGKNCRAATAGVNSSAPWLIRCPREAIVQQREGWNPKSEEGQNSMRPLFNPIRGQSGVRD